MAFSISPALLHKSRDSTAELWKLSHKNTSGRFPHSRNGAQKLLFLPPERAILDRFLNLAFSLRETLL